MRIATFAGLSAILAANLCLGQTEDDYTLTVEEYAVDGIAGSTTYRFYVDMANPDDFMSSVFGNEEDPFALTTTEPFYNDPAATGGSAGGINPSFLLPPYDGFFPGLGYDSWFTIGIESAPSGAETAVSAVESTTQPWIGSFDATSALSGQSVYMDDVTGGAWYVLNGTPNGIPDAENQRVLVAQVTTSGDISGIFNVQIFVNGIGENDLRPRFVFEGPGVYANEPLPEAIPGCTDSLACNFDETATEDDGTCVFADPASCESCDGAGGVSVSDADGDGVCDGDEIAGCTDAMACNYDGLATDDDGSCTFAEAGYDCDGNCLNDMDGDGVCDEFEVAGCTDANACNYNAAATDDDGSCTYSDLGYDCDGVCLSDADEDGVCDEFEVAGCQDMDACNFDANATDAADCIFAVGPCDVCDGMGGVIDNDQDDDGVCDADETSGCTFSEACNYNPNVTDDDGSCVYADDNCEVCQSGMVVLLDADGDGICDGDEVPGCTDAAACNFDVAATDDDGSCSYATSVLDCDGNCINDADMDGVCDEFEVEGCTDSMACNYDADATEDNGECEFPVPSYDCEGVCLNDMDMDGVCDEFEVSGCTDAMACNYDSSATDEDGSCTYAASGYDCDGTCLNDMDMDGVCDEFEVSGCTDAMACNYDSSATDDDGSCVFAEMGYDCNGDCLNDADMDGVCDEFEVLGCTDAMACNFDALATDDDGSCTFEEVGYDCDGNCLNDVDGDGVCDEFEISGCTDMTACNYNMEATDDDGSCTYPEAGYNCDGECLNDMDGDGICDEFEMAGCTDAEACNYDMNATDDDGSCVYAEAYYDCDGNCLNDSDGDGICDELEIPGCTDSEAYNYDENATEDDGSCAYCDLSITVDEVQPIDDSPGAISVTVGGTPGDTLTFAWSGPNGFTSDDEDIENISTGGIYVLIVTDENGCEAQVEVEVEVIDGVQDSEITGLEVYPNPASETLTFQSDAFSGQTWVRMFDLAGRPVVDVHAQVASGNLVLPVGQLANGTYTYILQIDGKWANGQVVVAN